MDISFNKIEELYNKAHFHEEANFSLLHKAASEYEDLGMALFRATDYTLSLKEAIEDFEKGRRVNPSIVSSQTHK